jgi:hypothetical protein
MKPTDITFVSNYNDIVNKKNITGRGRREARGVHI